MSDVMMNDGLQSRMTLNAKFVGAYHEIFFSRHGPQLGKSSVVMLPHQHPRQNNGTVGVLFSR